MFNLFTDVVDNLAVELGKLARRKNAKTGVAPAINTPNIYFARHM
jgi:hypothetical protein